MRCILYLMKLVPIHPFPARMAPEIVFAELSRHAPPKTVLDPMSGSGTVLRAAAELGHSAFGFDLDPLAVLMARVWTIPFSVPELVIAAEELIEEAKSFKSVEVPWIDSCKHTSAYVEFWFRKQQLVPLRSLALALSSRSGIVADALRVALSRIIITKEQGASIARDTSHSRPHRVFFDNDYDVYKGFRESVRRLSSRFHFEKLIGSAQAQIGDARKLEHLPEHSIDLVVTSPPYLNAIDYLRGHRLALVWLERCVSDIREIRARNIGAEAVLKKPVPQAVLESLLGSDLVRSNLSPRQVGMIARYAQDIYDFMKQLIRLLKKDGSAVFVVGNSRLSGVDVSNADITIRAAGLTGFELVSRSERILPSSHRYLPAPTKDALSCLSSRIAKETVMSFVPADSTATDFS